MSPPRAGHERLELARRHVGDRSRVARHARQVGVVEEHDDAVGGQVAVRLDVRRTRPRARRRPRRTSSRRRRARHPPRSRSPRWARTRGVARALEPAVGHDAGGSALGAAARARARLLGGIRDRAGERAAHALERLGELARDDPELARRAVGDLRQRLQVLVGEQLLVGVADVDGARRRSGWPRPRPGRAAPRPACRPRRAGSRPAVRPRPSRIADCFVPSAVRISARRSRSARICFSIESWMRVRRVDRLQLDAADADAPLAGGLVEHDAQLAVDLVAAGERLFEVEPADDVAKRRGGELLDGAEVVARSRTSRRGRR